MKSNFIHVCFVIDESGSMSNMKQDVIGGFKKIIDEQRANESGTCAVSYFTFADNVKELFKGKDVNDVDYIDDNYSPYGCTALFDGVGTAIDSIGKWLDNMSEDEKPEKNLIVVMTDGGENYSAMYKASQIKEMIKHQEDKYNWSFIYMGSDLTDASDANNMGFGTRLYSSTSDYSKNYTIINSAINAFRASEDLNYSDDAMCCYLTEAATDATVDYAAKKGISASSLLDNNNNNI